MLAVLSVATVTGCSSAKHVAASAMTTEPTSATHQIDGRFVATSADDFQKDDCTGNGGVSDIGPNTQVVIKNGKNEVVGVTHLGQAVEKRTANEVTGQNLTDIGSFIMQCSFNWTVSGIPDEQFYTVEVSHRGETTYSRADLEAQKWHVVTTL